MNGEMPRALDNPVPPTGKPARGFCRRVWVGLFKIARFVFLVLVLLWGSLAIYYSNLPWSGARVVLALVFFALGVWAIWVTDRPRPKWAFVAAYFGLLIWWGTIHPSHDREWRPEVAVLPRVVVEGDRVRFTGVRDFDFRTSEDFTVRYIEREFLISDLTSMDFFVSYWVEGPVGHTFVSFNFANAEPLCISIETRPEVGEGFNPLSSLFKQFELIYVVGEERDIVGLRTNHRDEQVYLYRIRTSPEKTRALFLIYIDRINQLADKAEFYHLLSNSCTINIIRYANAAGRQGGLDFRHVLNGLVDRYLYHAGFLDTGGLSFAEYRLRARVNQAAKAAEGSTDFPQRIRSLLPPRDK